MAGNIPWGVIAQQQAARTAAIQASESGDVAAIWSSFLTITGQGSVIYSAVGDAKTAFGNDARIPDSLKNAAAFTATGGAIQLGSRSGLGSGDGTSALSARRDIGQWAGVRGYWRRWPERCGRTGQSGLGCCCEI